MNEVSTLRKVLYVNRNSFENILSGCKTSLIEDNSREKYQNFDEVRIVEMNEDTKQPTGNSITCLITFIMQHDKLPDDYVIFSIKPLYQTISLDKAR